LLSCRGREIKMAFPVSKSDADIARTRVAGGA